MVAALVAPVAQPTFTLVDRYRNWLVLMRQDAIQWNVNDLNGMLVANQADMSQGMRPTRRIKMASGDSILHYFSTKISFTRRFLFQSIMNARRDNTYHIEQLFTLVFLRVNILQTTSTYGNISFSTPERIVCVASSRK